MNYPFNVPGSGTWTAKPPQGVSFFAPDLGASTPTPMNIKIAYSPEEFYFGQAHGIVTIDFSAPAAPAAQGFGLRSPLVLSFENDLGVPVNGFSYFLTDDSALPAGTPYDLKAMHPNNYAHFHGLAQNSFPGETLTLFDPNFGTGSFGPASTTNIPAPDFISAVGLVDVGATVVSSQIILHQEELPNRDNSFSLSFFISGTQGDVPLPTASVPEPSSVAILSISLIVGAIAMNAKRRSSSG